MDMKGPNGKRIYFEVVVPEWAKDFQKSTGIFPYTGIVATSLMAQLGTFTAPQKKNTDWFREPFGIELYSHLV